MKQTLAFKNKLKNKWMTITDPDRSGLFQPFFLLYFAMSFSYNLLRPFKQTLVITSQASGTEIIPALKIWGMIPATILATLLYTYISSRFSRATTFRFFISLFLVYYLLFITVLFPYSQFIEAQSLAHLLQHTLPNGFFGFVSMIRYWHFSLFYILSELWSNIIISVLFWGLANETVSMKEATKFYAWFNVGGNAAAIAAGWTGSYISNLSLKITTSGYSAFDSTAYLTTAIVIMTGIFILVIFQPLSLSPRLVAKDSSNVEPTETSLLQSMKSAVLNPYILMMTLMVFSYHLTFNLSDTIWMEQLRAYFEGSPHAFNHFLYRVVFFKGLLSTFLSLFFTHKIIDRFGWRAAALFTPGCILLTSLFFYPAVLTAGFTDFWTHLLPGVDVLFCIVLVGAIQHVLSRSTKYSLFDATKEMAFIPLDLQTKRQAKALIDGIGSRFGKSSAAIVLQLILCFYSGLAEAIPLISVCSIIMVILWIGAVFYIAKGIHPQSNSKEAPLSDPGSRRPIRVSDRGIHAAR